MTQILFLNARSDCRWLLETHLKPGNLVDVSEAGLLHLQLVESFILEGNEDCPKVVRGFTVGEPQHDAPPFFVASLQEDGRYAVIFYSAPEDQKRISALEGALIMSQMENRILAGVANSLIATHGS